MRGQPPIIIAPYDFDWPAKFEAERQLLSALLGPFLVGSIEHIGSTSVLGMPAKPVIDILGPVRDLESSRPAIDLLGTLGYRYFPYEADVMHWLCKPSDVERTHHLHLVPFGSRLWRERLAFRDALRSDGAVRRAYAELKRKLAAEFRDDREAYTEGKTAFIQSVVRSALG